MALRLCTLAAGFAAASAMNLVNRESGLCLDLHAPCLDGGSDKDCQRVSPEDLKQGTNLQLFHCNGKKNQEFELTNDGRIRNPLTKLCTDIMAPCKDHFRTPCERVAVTELKKEANIQLYTCHEDEGVLSNSYGNQMWNFQNGQLRNWLSNMCLEPLLDSDGKMVPEANIHADTCEEAMYQKFDLLSWISNSDSDEKKSDDGADAEVPAEQAVQTIQKFQLSSTQKLQQKFSSNFHHAHGDTLTQALVGVGIVGCLAAVLAFVGRRAAHARPGQGLVAEE